MARLPIHPRLAHMLCAASDAAARALAVDLAALLTERDPLGRQAARAAGADIAQRLDIVAAARGAGTLPASVDRAVVRQIGRVAGQLDRLLARAPGERSPPGLADAGALLALAYPDRVAMRAAGDSRRYLMRNGRAALLDPADALCGRRFLVIADLDAGEREGRVWLAAALSDERFDLLFADQVHARREVRWDSGRKDVVARRVRRLDALLLADEPDALTAEDPVAEVLLAQVREQGLAAFFDDPRGLRARVQMMRGLEPQGAWPDFSETGLLATLDDWLLPWLRGGEGVRQLRRLALHELLTGWLGWELQQRLDAALPLEYPTAAGTRRRISYDFDTDPVLALPLQEVLGMSDGPVLAGGRVTPVLHLLSPAGRPLQVTRDLAGFWRGAYPEVKKEMRGRYPKHYWPDDPAAARATRFTKRRMGKDGD